MAFGTLAFLRTMGELPFVRIGLMTVRAIGKGQRPLEIAAQVALGTSNFRVQSEERIFGFGMVERESR